MEEEDAVAVAVAVAELPPAMEQQQEEDQAEAAPSSPSPASQHAATSASASERSFLPHADDASTSELSAVSVAAATPPGIQRSASGGLVGFRSTSGFGARSRSRSSGSDHPEATSELILQLQRLCRRQRQRSEERGFVRDVERVLALLQSHPGSSSASASTSATYPVPGGPTLPVMPGDGASRGGGLASVQEHTDGERRASVASSASTATTIVSSRRQQPMERVAPTLAELDALLDCIADLFEHRNPGVRALAFEVMQLCLLRFGERLTPALRRKIFLRLETHAPGDFLLRQKALRALTQDGRHLEPFRVELGWLLLRLLEQSDAQRDLLGLIQSILRRSPRALDRDKVIALASVVSARCDVAWSRRDLEACRRFVAFFHVLAAHDLAYAASTPACLRSLCCLVNADGSGTWAVLKLLLGSAAGFHVLRGLLHVLENPRANSRWVLRGAVFFVGMSCWGSQRVARFDELAWAPILLALERALQCHRGFVIFEVILALQRLIKKFGSSKSPSTATSGAQSELKDQRPKLPTTTSAAGAPVAGAGASSSPNGRDKRLVMEWDIILRMFRTLRPWVSMTDEDEIEDSPSRPAPAPDSRRAAENGSKAHRSAAIHPASEPPLQLSVSVSIQQTRIPRELLDTLQIVEELVAQRLFAGDTDEFLAVLEEYLPHLSERSMLFLLRQRAEAAHPGYHVDWLATLSSTMTMFFSCRGADGDALVIPCAVRLEALEVLQMNLWTSRNVCEDRVIEEVVLPTLGRVYEDVDAEVRCRALGFVIEVARQLESVKFDALLDILASAMTLSSHEDAQLVAASGIVSLFSSAFNHLPPTRAVRMYDLLATTVETHRSCGVRRVALECLLHVSEARATDGRLQWKDHRVRTSRFLFVSRRAARVSSNGVPPSTTTAWVPVTRALRALLTLVSAEPDAELFRMAVRGIKTMLENRVVLADVDISEVAAKVVASIDYRAFGRAAIADDVARQLKDPAGRSNSSEAANGDEGEGDEALVALEEGQREDRRRVGRPISLTDADLLRSLHVSSQVSDTGGASDIADDAASFAASLRATAALLAKTRFLAMGLELLQLLVSYEAKLHEHALHELIRCLVGTLDLRLAVAEKDLFAGGGAVADETAASASSSARTQGMIYRRGSDISDPYVSGTPRGFTSRVFSRFQSSTTHGSLFHALSSSVSKSSMASASASAASSSARPSREDRARLQTSLRQLFNAEFSLLHTATTALSLLVLLAPKSVLNQIESVLHSARTCITTVDGDFRADAFGAVLELLGTVVLALRGATGGDVAGARKAIVEMLLLGFEYAKSRQLSYLAFRLLGQVVHQSGRRERVALAELAMPTLQQCARRANSLLAEAAVDFLMCFAYSQSTLVPTPLCSRTCLTTHNEGHGLRDASDAKSSSRSRSWTYKSSLLTITTTPRGYASLVIRRANCTSHWELSLHHELARDPVSLATGRVSTLGLSASLVGHDVDVRDVLTQRAGGRAEPKSRNVQSALPTEVRALCQSSPALNRPTETPLLASTASNGQRPMEDVVRELSVAEEEGKVSCEGSDEDAVGPHFSHSPAAASLPPLPAYDGIGGSPSYFCESAQVRRQPTHRSSRSSSLKPLRQSEGEDDQERSRDSNRTVGVIREGVEEHDENEVEEKDEDAMDAFVLDDSSRDFLSASTNAPSRSASLNQDEAATAASTGGSQDASSSGTSPDMEQYDPMYLMMQLFDLTVENRPQLLTEGPSLALALSVLDRTPEYETHKIGLLYVRDEKQHSETAVLGNVGGSLRYLRFLRGLGSFTKLEGLAGYTGGLDSTNNSDGKFGLVYKDECAQIMFHVATMMVPEIKQSSGGVSSGIFAAMKKKRHIGNDFVHVVFKECDEEYDVQTLSGQFNDVHIVIQPLNEMEYRTQVHVKPGIAPFGPLYGTQIVASTVISESVRLTCLNANLACQIFHQDLVGYSMNCEDRLKQIKQLGLRLAAGDEWRLDS